jgi:DNA-binding GntR family transcriptional regulator
MDSSLTLARLVEARLRADILHGVHRPGAKLRLEALRERYGVGASPLREALAALAAEGLVQRLDQRGFRVAGADQAALADLVETRCLAETAALRAAIVRGDAAWEERVLVAHHRLARASRSLEADAFVPNPAWDALHRDFHLALLEPCGAPSLLAFCADLHDRSTRFRNLSNSLAYPQRDVAAEHAALCEVTLARRAEDAAALLEKHYRHTANVLGDALEQKTAVESDAG